jgi:cell division protein FtsI (penicillin-binding protein 3)
VDLRKVILVRYSVLFGFILVAAFSIIVKIMVIQFSGAHKWSEKLYTIVNRTETVYGTRGNICATDGNVLATSVPFYQIRFDAGAPAVRAIFRDSVDALALELSKVFPDRSKAQFKKQLTEAYKQQSRYYLIHPRKVNYDELQRIKKFPIFDRGKNKGGFIVEQDYVRVAPHGRLAYRTIGLLNKDAYGGVHGSEGISGIEEKYEDYLRGGEGVCVQQNLSGRWVNVTSVDPDDGNDVVTTIDVFMQDVVETALRTQLEKSEAEYGTAILMEVQTGKIRAIANLGLKDGSYYEIYNYAYGHEGCNEPGSTFKLVSMMAALEKGVVDTSDIVDIEDGRWQIYDRTIYDSDYGESGYGGKMSVKQIFEKSSNVGVAKIITQGFKGKESDFIDFVYGLGLNKKLDIGFKGEAEPYIKKPGDKNWWGTSLAYISHGYELKISPLQTLAIYNAIANDGKMMKPMFVESISRNGVPIKKFSPEVLKSSVCSGSTLNKLKGMLEGVVLEGTAKNLRTGRYAIAGKTGTAKIANKNKGYSEAKYRASFAGYFPADNPKYTCVVVVSEPKGAFYGNSVAGPVFREIADCIYGFDSSMRMAKNNKEEDDLPSVKNGLIAETKAICRALGIKVARAKAKGDYAFTKETEDDVELTVRPLEKLTMPNVVGMGATDAVYLIEKAGMKPKMDGVGKVVRQSPGPGEPCQKGQMVYIDLS